MSRFTAALDRSNDAATTFHPGAHIFFDGQIAA
jgi:hypothetical protein